MVGLISIWRINLNKHEKEIFDLVRAELKDEFVPESYRGKVNSEYCGHCHHATVAMYKLLGGKEKGYKIKKAIDELEITHYWLVTAHEEIIDPTAEQYTDLGRKLPYDKATTKGVEYRVRSNAAKTIIENVAKKCKSTYNLL
jgi:hypothetical protein